jgi:ABC-2 type transport system permease protein
MHKTWLIIKREYLTRVRKKTFIIGTLLFPLLYLLLIFGTGYIAEKTRKTLNVALIDSSGQDYFNEATLQRANLVDPSSKLTLIKGNEREVIADYKKFGYDGYVVIDSINWETQDISTQVLFKSNKSFGTGTTDLLGAKINRVWDDVKNEKLGIDATKRKIIGTNRIIVKPINIQDEKADAATSRGIGWACGILIYMIILIYGSQVMMGVMEEKTNRIAEIIVSSVKPFQMMLGKIIGIAMVALTQFLLWIIFILVIYNVTKLSGSAGASTANQLVGSVQQVFTSVNLPFTLLCFAFYFLGGFFFYSSLYGAIGSAINEDVREAQSLAFPVTMLVIVSIALMTSTVENPTGPVAVWASIIPFTSPIVMMSRIPYGVPGTVPWWQLGVSMLSLIIGFLFTTWFASKIYRTGILMYGKKASWKEMLKWAFRRS